MGDHLKADAAKPAQIADELFCLVVPIDDANCSLLNFLSHWIIEASTCQHVPTKKKQENGGGAPAASLMPKSDQGIWRVKESVFF